MILESPIQKLHATSPITKKKLNSLGIYTFQNLLEYFPFRYDDVSSITSINNLIEGQKTTIQGIVLSSKNELTRRGFRLQKVTVSDSTGQIDVTWINQPYIIRVLTTHTKVSISGEVTRFAGKLIFSPIYWEVDKKPLIHTARIVPVYSETKGLSSKVIREKIFTVFSLIKKEGASYDPLPVNIRKSYDLLPYLDALFKIHFPYTKNDIQQAKKRLGFDELFYLQLYLQHEKQNSVMQQAGKIFYIDKTISDQLNTFISHLPFILTRDQKKVIEELKKDLTKNTQMNRFLQGDVGSGKTILAFIASYIAYLNKSQALFMAPTEVLAMQHYKSAQSFLQKTGMTIALLTGSTNKKSKVHNADLVIGTHSLLHSSFTLKPVGLIIIDEQHRFGVSQRALLNKKGLNPHILTMTATPIPRTLALTFFGDLDISTLSILPTGRIPVKTHLVPQVKRSAAYEWIIKEIINKKTQVYIICPLIEESDSENLNEVKAAKKEFEYLKNNIFVNQKVSLLHGKLSSKEKQHIISEFAKGNSDVLVSTSVVEVGIDIPNATVMLIEGAQRYGLAQLHQLRGRVGRGSKQSYCFLFTDSQEEAVIKRLTFFAQTTDGRLLSEYDLQNRGPGNILGIKQHGFLKLKVASFSDLELIKKTREAAQTILKASPDLSRFPDLIPKLLYVKDKDVIQN